VSTQFDLKPIALGMVFAMMTLLFGETIGMVFGVAEDPVEEWISATIAANPANPDLVTKSPEAIAKKSARYILRGHFHGTGIGAMSVGLILAIGASWVSARWKMLLSLGVGVGGFIYPICWLGAGLLMPSIGKEAAKGAMEILVFPSIGMQVTALLITLWIWVASFRSATGVPDGYGFLKR